jgi:hypothetical protein
MGYDIKANQEVRICRLQSSVRRASASRAALAYSKVSAPLQRKKLNF